MTANPAVSIILPTYNRIDTLERAVRSVTAQTFEDWELIVVDDGSQDGSHALIEKHASDDPRIRLLRQANGGVAAARNTGLAAARGQWITFLDSDDAWLPHFLDLTTSFLRSEPDKHFVQDYGNGVTITHNRDDVLHYLRLSRTIGSACHDLPPGETDPYLRFYSSYEAVGEWGHAALKQAGVERALLYRGDISRHMRWGYLNWLPVTMITRHALETVGPFVPTLRTAEDYRFLALLARHFTANMIAIPGAVKYERAEDAGSLRQEHLAKGVNAYRFELNKLACFDELYGPQAGSDAELPLIRRHYEYDAGFAALRHGLRNEAVEHLKAAACQLPRLRTAYALLALAYVAPHGPTAARILYAFMRVSDLMRRARDKVLGRKH